MDKNSRHDDDEDGEDDSPSTPIAMMPDGLPGPLELIAPPPVPNRHPDVFVCLRGPCRHYWRLKTMAGEGNPEGTFDEPKLMVHHTCLVNPGFETAFADDNAYECNKWDPEDPGAQSDRQLRRDTYLALHPEYMEKNNV